MMSLIKFEGRDSGEVSADPVSISTFIMFSVFKLGTNDSCEWSMLLLSLQKDDEQPKSATLR